VGRTPWSAADTLVGSFGCRSGCSVLQDLKIFVVGRQSCLQAGFLAGSDLNAAMLLSGQTIGFCRLPPRAGASNQIANQQVRA
jgi:hypothetical protein